MQFGFSYDKNKVIQALRYHFISRKEIKILIVLVNVFAVLSAVLFFFRKVSPLAFLVSSFLWVALMIAFWFILPHVIYRQTQAFKDSFILSIHEPVLRLENERGYTEWEWKSFESYFETPGFFHLYFNTKTFFLIPKEGMSDEFLQELRDSLRTKVGKN
jgi:hypothetical protein